MNNTEGFVVILTYLAVITSAISGALEARAYNMDAVGATTVAFVTAFGGGTLRDLLLGRTPIFWLVDPWLSVVTFIIAIISFYSINHISETLLFIPDALSLGFFSVLGSTFALQMELPLLVASLMGVVTGVFGGVLRDVLCNKIPNIFQRDIELYATCSFIGVWIFIFLIKLGMEASVASWIGTFIVVGIRILAVKFHIKLPIP
ncbi:MAG TPA: trimeric intracellular cation channel family protein [Anaerolineales bacterium]|nr:trimeric intracellular cation channel family protein [Anaerolineales bacterium]